MLSRLFWVLLKRTLGIDLVAVLENADETIAALDAGEIEGWGFENA